MATSNIYELADTWNAGGTTFTAIKMDVTDIASAAGSNLMDLLVNSASKFRVDKAANLFMSGFARAINTQATAPLAPAALNLSALSQDALRFSNDRDITVTSFPLGADAAPFDISLIAQAALPAATTNLIGADLNINGGAGASGSAGLASGGNVSIDGGAAFGTGVVGNIIMASLPTSDPAVTGALWNNSNVMNISA
ncbi:hypothetical protein KAR91_54335 [Candidatus Pacearchaeota archaeon]|nr:hypothetical protein [Candidatus Pacearchaeota archaeon]